MFLFVPYRVDALYDHPPVANWSIMAVTCVMSLFALFVPGAWDTTSPLILSRGNLPGLVGHMFLHGDVFHLAGNMLFLWIFGNIISANMTHARYTAFYLTIGLVAGFVHLVVAGNPAIGASGAINGIVGVTLAAYPRDRVHTFWLFLVRGGTMLIRLWVLVLIWLFFDLWGAFTGGSDVAYWAHIGGLLTGVGLGLLALTNGWIHMTVFDKRTLLERLGGSPSDRKP